MQRDPERERGPSRVPPIGLATGLVLAIVFYSALALVLVLLLGGGARASGYWGPTDKVDIVPLPGSVLVIERATGGSIALSISNYKRMESEGTQVRIVGTCASACILLLRHRNVCYTPEARFVFHGAYNRETGAYNQKVSYAFARSLPPKLGEWALANGAVADPDHYVTITGAQVASLDNQERLCQ